MFHDSQASWGGAILNSGDVVLSDCWFWNNSATWGGGAICNDQEGTVTLEDCHILSNLSSKGGGIYNEFNSTIWISGTQIYGNTAGQQGGGIFNRGELEMTGGYLGANEANASGGGMDPGRGGGYYGQAGSAIFEFVDIASNTATDRGGGFYVEDGHLEFLYVTLAGNAAPTGPGGYLGGGTLSHYECEISGEIAP